MPRTLPKQVLRFIASTAVVALLTTHPAAATPQKTASPQSQAQLEEHVKELEKRLDAAELKTASAAMEKDYITRVQKQYETYYEKAFNTQVWILSILGIILTTLFFLTGKIGFAVFDRRIDSVLAVASAQLRTEFNQQLRTDLDALRASNAAQIKHLESNLTKQIGQLQDDLRTQFKFQYSFSQGFSAFAARAYGGARTHFRSALAIYIAAKARKLIEERAASRCAEILFHSFNLENAEHFKENAEKELTNPLYNDLQDELAHAAARVPELAPLLARERPTEPTIKEADPNGPPPADTSNDGK